MPSGTAIDSRQGNRRNLLPLSTKRQAFSPLTVFCDFDGPIVDVSDRYYQTYQLGLAEVQANYQATGITLPIHLLTKEQFWQMKQNRVPDVEIAMRSGLSGAEIDLFLRQVVQIVNQPTLLDQDYLQPGVRWALTMLHNQGARLALVTLRCQQQAIQILNSHSLLSMFSGIWGAQDQGVAYLNHADHKTQLLTEAIASFGDIAPHTAWMVGDTEADVLAGQATDIPTIALTCGIRSQTYLKKFEPTRIHSDLLSAAHYLVYQKNGSKTLPF